MAENKKPLIVSFYSYKGGTGRTTAAANVASILAKNGKQVVCIDMDMEGPGLSVVFNISENVVKNSIQKYFSEECQFDENLLLHLNKILNIPKGWNNLYLVPGSSTFSGVIDYSDGNRMINRMNELKQSILQLCSPEFLILDSPNGYGDLAALSMYFSDYLVVLFRWSRQHLIGTIRVSEFTKRYGISFLPVASCVPPDKKGRKNKWLKLIKSEMEIEDPLEIADDDELKWIEKVVLFDDNPQSFKASDGYNQIADKLLERMRVSLERKQ